MTQNNFVFFLNNCNIMKLLNNCNIMKLLNNCNIMKLLNNLDNWLISLLTIYKFKSIFFSGKNVIFYFWYTSINSQPIWFYSYSPIIRHKKKYCRNILKFILNVFFSLLNHNKYNFTCWYFALYLNQIKPCVLLIFWLKYIDIELKI